MSGAERKKKESVGWGSELKKSWNEFSEAVNWKRRKVGLLCSVGCKKIFDKDEWSRKEGKGISSMGIGIEEVVGRV
jgi:hypothetical protein